MTWEQRPCTWKWSHSQFHSSPERRIRWVPLSPRKDTSRFWNWTRSGSAAYRFAFSILEMRLEFMSSSRSVFARGRRGSSGVEPSIGRPISLGIPVSRLAPCGELVAQARPNIHEYRLRQGEAIWDRTPILVDQIVRQSQAESGPERRLDVGVLLQLRAHRLLSERVVRRTPPFDALATDVDVPDRGTCAG